MWNCPPCSASGSTCASGWLADQTIEVWTLELPGSGSGLVFVGHEQNRLRVLKTYGIATGGNGGRMSIVDTWLSPDCPMAIVLVEQQTDYRSFYAEPGNENSLVEGGTESLWVALGLAPDRAWLASEVQHGTTTLIARDGWPELHVQQEQLVTLELRRDTLRFEPVAGK